MKDLATGAGSHELTAKYVADGNMAGLAANFTLTLGQKTLTANLGEIGNQTYTGRAISPEIRPTFVGAVNGHAPAEGVDYEVKISNNVNAGTATVEVKPKDGGNYTFTTVNKTFTILPADLTISAQDAAMTQGETLPEFTYTAEGLLGTDEIETVKLTCETDGKTAGTFAIVPSEASLKNGKTNNYTIHYENGTLTVEKVPVTSSYYTLTFETNGGNALSAIRKLSGSAVDLSKYVPVREGYTFLGWYADEELTEAVTSIRMNRNTTVYAAWQKDECPRDETCPAARFEDVNLNAWYHDGVHYCVENGLMVGTGETTFAPQTTTSRAMIATILWRQAGSPVVNYLMDFSDVAQDMWYSEAIRWAASEGIAVGYGDGRFGPNDPITREQLATMLYHYEQKQGGGFVGMWAFRLDFSDVAEVSEWAYEPMCWMVMHGVIEGMDDGRLAPKGNATRAEAAAMLMRFGK